MKLKNIFALNVMAAALVACGGGDVNLNPSVTPASSTGNVSSTPVVSSSSSVSSSSISSSSVSSSSVAAVACASYSQGGQTFTGTLASGNCTYPVAFASNSKQITANLTIPELPNGGVHIFEGSIFIGEDVTKALAEGGKAIPQNGAGATLTINAGAKIAFQRGEDYVRIARGSKIVADGTKDKPIIFSAVKDLVEKTATIADRGLWGGLQINGNGLTNKCTDTERLATSNNIHACHILSEGLPGTYGGNNNTESSGSLKYVVVKHAGYKVVEGNELNAINFNAVGSGTVVDHVQSYAAQDDAFEWFGGAVNAKHIVSVGTSDDSFDFTEGYVGHIQYALSVAPTGVGGNHCVEADNAGKDRLDDSTPLTKVRISNLTCVTNNIAKNGGTVISPDGDSLGLLIREGFFIELYNSIVTSNATGMNSKQLFIFHDTEGPQTIKAANDGWSVAKSNLLAGTGGTAQTLVNAANAGFTTATWLANATNTNNVVVTAPAQLPVNVLKNLATNDKAYLTLPTITDAASAVINITLFDVSKLADLAQPAVNTAPVAGTSTFFVNPTHLGAASETNDWVAGWTVGL
ncbi:MAG: hypothetical protein B0W54_08855 [Cellvibrio sp. 79]|nr:MAG: hypothetical protein B0W54_08855 [Cellvibrio sp. 79]